MVLNNGVPLLGIVIASNRMKLHQLVKEVESIITTLFCKGTSGTIIRNMEEVR